MSETKDQPAKAAAIALLSRGQITKSEAARLAGVSRQLMRHWTKDIQAEKARYAVLGKLWARSLKR